MAGSNLPPLPSPPSALGCLSFYGDYYVVFHSFFAAPIVCLVLLLGPCFVVLFLAPPFSLSIMRRTDCFTLIVLWLSYSVSLPHGAVGWSAVFEFSIPGHTHLLCFC